MKIFFERRDNKLLVTGIVIGSVATVTAAYLFFTNTGVILRKQISERFKRITGAFNDDEPAPVTEHATAYLHHNKMVPKTDRQKLLKHQLLRSEPAVMQHNDDPKS